VCACKCIIIIILHINAWWTSAAKQQSVGKQVRDVIIKQNAPTVILLSCVYIMEKFRPCFPNFFCSAIKRYKTVNSEGVSNTASGLGFHTTNTVL